MKHCCRRREKNREQKKNKNDEQIKEQEECAAKKKKNVQRRRHSAVNAMERGLQMRQRSFRMLNRSISRVGAIYGLYRF